MRNSENSRNELVRLKDLDNLLKCGICYEYMKTTLITPCSHNYCSYCIRQSLSYRNQCPSCFEDVNDSQLRNNRIVDEFIAILPCIKDKLHRYLSYLPNSKSDFENPKEDKEISERENIKEVIGECTAKLPTPKSSLNETISHGGTPTKTMPSTSKKDVLIPSIFSPKKQKTSNNNEVKVTCPICSVEIPEKNINVHLDACLKRSEEKRMPQGDKQKSLPKLVYHLLPDKELRKKLNELGLSTVGNRTTLINRHKRYTILYNSEWDSLKPRPVAEIIKQLNKEEEEEKKLMPQVVKKLNVDRKADPQVNEEAQRQYLQEHKTSFKELIEKARRSKDAKKKSNTPKGDEPKVITIDEGSDSSENEFKIQQTRKRKIITSDSESESENSTEEIKDVSRNVTCVDINVSTNPLEERKSSEHSVSASNKENEEKAKCTTSVIKFVPHEVYQYSTDEMETDDDLAEDVSQEVVKHNRRKAQKVDRTLQLQTCSNSLPSVTSPVLVSKCRVNRTPKSRADHINSFKRDLTPELKSPRACAPSSSPGITAGQEPDEDVVDSDSSSNHSTSLMVYTGPDYDTNLDSSSPKKTPNKSDSLHDSSFSGTKKNFDLGIDDILQNSEEFESLPVRRQSKRIKETNKSLPESNAKSGVQRKRIRLDDL